MARTAAKGRSSGARRNGSSGSTARTNGAGNGGASRTATAAAKKAKRPRQTPVAAAKKAKDPSETAVAAAKKGKPSSRAASAPANGAKRGSASAARAKSSGRARGANGKSSGAGRKVAGAGRKAQGAGRSIAQTITPSPTKAVGKAIKPGSITGRLARAAAKKTFKALARRAAESGAHVVRLAADRSTALSKNALENGLSRRLPIQVSIDVAVPLAVAWDEWLGSGAVPEGVHRIHDVERDGDYLTGTVAGPRSTPWEAEIVDEREHESFAWRSTEGSDCAGLVTFHQLSERLTRIELDLDVLPTNPAEAFTLSLHLAHRRAEADLRRFKAHVEFISPDVYENKVNQNGSAPDE